MRPPATTTGGWRGQPREDELVAGFGLAPGLDGIVSRTRPVASRTEVGPLTEAVLRSFPARRRGIADLSLTTLLTNRIFSCGSYTTIPPGGRTG
jgi:hypothetical protein